MGRILRAGQGVRVRWSNRMQTTGQVECKWVVKSMQLRIHAIHRLESGRAADLRSPCELALGYRRLLGGMGYWS